MRYSENVFILTGLILTAALINPAPVFSWPFGGSKTKSAAPAPAPAPQESTNQERAEEEKSEEELAKEYAKQQVEAARRIEVTAESAVGISPETPIVPIAPKVPRAPKIPKAGDYKINSASVQPTQVDAHLEGLKKYSATSKPTQAIEAQKLQVPVPGAMNLNLKSAKSVEDTEISKIQSQIQDILKLNESLKTQYSGQSAEIQKIGEQAKIHQKILQDLQKTPEAPSAKAEEVLQLEKIRVIKKETEENHRYIESLKESNASQSTDQQVSQKVAV
jgi:hypothetical protein